LPPSVDLSFHDLLNRYIFAASIYSLLLKLKAMEPNETKRTDGPEMKKYILGVVVIVAGFLLLLSNTGFLPYDLRHILFSWQMLLIGIGIVSLFTSESRTPGTILILIGGTFILPRVFNFPFDAMHLFWPVILIGVGILILTKRMPRRPWQHNRHQFQSEHLEEGYLHEENIFSGGKQRVVHQVFRGGHINCIFGGAEVDLTQAVLADGISELEVNTIFGGVTLIVPADWRIQLKMTSIMGGFSDKRSYVKENPDTSRMLIIKGSTIFGGGELKSY
jgi:predicted membrane protein